MAWTVKAAWDDEARVWYVQDSNVPGLATGADTFEALIEKLKIVIPELLAENGLTPSAEGLSFSVKAERLELAHVV
jgi:Domain of unknown function (DUF1902)